MREMLKVVEEKDDEVEIMLEISQNQTMGGLVNHDEEFRVKLRSIMSH